MKIRSYRWITEVAGGTAFFLACASCASLHAQQQGTVTYVYTDPQGTPLAETDANGTITKTFDYTPYGTLAMGNNPPNGPGYTGHVNDPETNLVYMQHRYYDPTTGRFLSRDAVPPKPGDLNYTNRYAYVGNNPILRTDPTGDYICNGSGDQCTTIRQALGDVQKAAGQYAQGSQGQKLLTAIVNFYGKEGVANGVNVGFGSANNNNAITETKGKETNITFNLKNIGETGQNKGTTPRVETAATVAHEGQHGIDGQFFGRTINREEWRSREYSAFTSQSYVNEAFNKTSPYGVWEHGWKESPITNGLRDSAANFQADWTVYGNGANQ
jgi:RHS repeat-associated protein